MHVVKKLYILDILPKVKTYRFADIAIILRENLVEIPKKYKTEAPYCLTLCVNGNVVSRSKTKRQEGKGVRLCPAYDIFLSVPRVVF
jgi:hypothetical protein